MALGGFQPVSGDSEFGHHDLRKAHRKGLGTRPSVDDLGNNEDIDDDLLGTCVCLCAYADACVRIIPDACTEISQMHPLTPEA